MPHGADDATLQQAYDQVDWSTTDLGDPQGWTPALRAALDLVRSTHFPATLLWGPRFELLYNEAYIPLIADKHPAALGAPAEQVFPEAWDTIGPLLRSLLAGEGTVRMDEALVPLHRRGFLEECSFTFSYSAVCSSGDTASAGAGGAGHDAAGAGKNAKAAHVVEGVIDIAVETTTQVQDRRRLELLARLNAVLSETAYLADAVHQALALLRSATSDLAEVDIHPAPTSAGSTAASGSAVGSRLPAHPTRPARSWLDSDVVLDKTGAGTLAWLPLSTGESSAPPGMLVVRLHPMLAVDERYLQFLQLVAASLAQALSRVAVREERRRVAAAGRAMSEALQRSLLDSPAHGERFEVAVRYQPATDRAQVGGDWYDAFDQREGTLAVVIGDVSGHDREAAVTMAQVRNLLRGIALSSGPSDGQSSRQGPAAVLAGLEMAMTSLGLDAYATAVLAQVEVAAGAHSGGDRTGDGGVGGGVSGGVDDGVGGGVDEVVIRWCNAGHPPPVLISAQGEASLLETDSDVLLGLAVEHGRRDHLTALPVGASLVLYTDGLVERRGRSLEKALHDLRDFLGDYLSEHTGGARQDGPPVGAERVCNALLERFSPGADDDIALLVLRRRW